MAEGEKKQERWKKESREHHTIPKSREGPGGGGKKEKKKSHLFLSERRKRREKKKKKKTLRIGKEKKEKKKEGGGGEDPYLPPPHLRGERGRKLSNLLFRPRRRGKKKRKKTILTLGGRKPFLFLEALEKEKTEGKKGKSSNVISIFVSKRNSAEQEKREKGEGRGGSRRTSISLLFYCGERQPRPSLRKI